MYTRTIKEKEEVCFYRESMDNLSAEEFLKIRFAINNDSKMEGLNIKCKRLKGSMGGFMNDNQFCVGCKDFKTIEQGRIESKGW